jgi:hypothetical protein
MGEPPVTIINEPVITDWLIAFGTIAVAIAAVFQDKIRSWLTRPKLEASIDVEPPDCHKTSMVARSPQGQVIDRTDCYYFRIRVKNSGNQRAEYVEVYAAEVLKKQDDDTFKRLDSFAPMNLVWSHVVKPFFPAISRNMEKHCDLGHIIEPAKRVDFGEDSPQLAIPATRTFFCLETEVKPFHMGHLLPPGQYHLKLVIAAANAKPIEKTLEINHTGDWYDDEARMLSDGIGIRML